MAIISCGWNSNKDRSTYSDTEKTCNSLGISTVRFDFRGTGETGGDLSDANLQTMVEDTKFLYDRTSEKYEKIILISFSASAESSLVFLPDRFSKISNVLLVCPGLGKKMVGEDNFKRENYWDKTKHCRYIEFSEYKNKLQNLSQNVRILHGEKDERVPISQSEELIDLIPDSELTIHPKADHKFSNFLEDRQAWIKGKLEEIIS